jgi:predicted nucleotidyltransferase
MKRELQNFKDFLNEAVDPAYYQDTFYFTVLISMDKNRGGSRDETKNDIRALPEVLTVTLVEKEKGGVQKDLGNSYMSTLKLHIRRPRDVSKEIMMKRLVKQVAALKGVSVLRYKERKPKQRKKAFRGPGSYKLSEADYQKSPARKRRLRVGFKRLTQTGPNNSGPFKAVKQDPSWKSAPPGAPGGLEETQLEEVMKTAATLPKEIVVVIDKDKSLARYPAYKIYYALKGEEDRPLKAGDMDRMEREAAEDREPVYGMIKIGRHVGAGPYKDTYLVTSVNAAHNYGPLLYDVAMELAGKDGLKPDVDSVSSEAAAVWKYYDTARSDVESSFLVDDEYEYEEVMPPEHAAKGDASDHLAKAYYMVDSSPMADLGDKLVRLDKANPMGRDLDALYEDVLVTIGAPDDDLMAFDVQPELNQKIWNKEDGVRPGVKGALMDIIDEFMEGLDLDLQIKDVVVTGSIANYNWSKFSDIDLHILLDFAEVNEDKDMVKRFFDAVRSNWNKLHNIFVKGHEVEIYVQDEHEPHISTGVYSLLEDRWLVKPKKVRPAIDRGTATKKMLDISREIDKLSLIHDRKNYEASFEMAERLKEKIKKMRQHGLQASGIYSPENLAFKMLRRSGDIEQLFSIYTEAYDKLFSLDQ